MSRAPPASPPTSPLPGQRLDKWLWYARFARSRSLAAKLCAEGAVTLGGVAMIKPHHPVRPGDRLTIRQGRWLRRVTVERLGERRGPAVEARRLYDEPAAPAPVDGAEPPWTPLLDDGSDEHELSHDGPG